MPSFFAKVPFWVWPILGLILLALSIPGFLEAEDKRIRQAALASDVPTLIDLEEFEPAKDIALAGEVNIFAQTHPDHSYLIQSDDGAEAHVVPLFSALASPKAKNVSYVLLASDLNAFESWLNSNTVGMARMGDLYEINGQIVPAEAFSSSIQSQLKSGGLTLAEDLMVIRPFVNGRVVGLSHRSRQTFGNPYILSLSGLWMMWFGGVVWSRMRKLKTSVKRRMGEIEERSGEKGEINMSRLKRRSRQLAKGELTAEVVEKAAVAMQKPTPAE